MQIHRVGLLALAAALHGCGGGGGSSNGGTAQVAVAPPTPAPTPTPTPTPASALPPAPFALAASQAFAVEGWLFAKDTAIPLDQTTFSFEWSAQERTYVTRHPDAGAGRLEYTFPGRNPFAFSLLRDGATVPLSYYINVSQAASGSGNFYREQDAPADWRIGEFAFGVPTPASAIPASGSRRYGAAVLEGSGVDLTVDFASGTISGSIYTGWVDAWSSYAPVRYELPAIPFDRSTGRFVFKTASTRASLAIELAGRFAGPTAREIVVRYDAPVFDPYNEVWVSGPQAAAVPGV